MAINVPRQMKEVPDCAVLQTLSHAIL